MAKDPREPFDDLPALRALRDSLERQFIPERTFSRSRRLLPAWARRRSRPLAVVVILVACGGSAAAVAAVLNTPSAPLAGTIPSRLGASQSPSAGEPEAGLHYRVSVTPVLTAGAYGWASFIDFEANSRSVAGGGGGGNGYPTRTSALFDLGVNTIGVPPQTQHLGGDIVDYVLTGPNVTAVRVGDRAISTRSSPGLPAGDRVAVFFMPADAAPVAIPPPGSALPYYEPVSALPSLRVPSLPLVRSTGRPTADELKRLAQLGRSIAQHRNTRLVPTTPLAAIGPDERVIRPRREASFVPAGVRSWRNPARPSPGACALRYRGLPTLIPEWGSVVATIRPVRGPEGELFLSCADTEFSLHGWPLHAAILVDAHAPGRALVALPGAVPVKGQPGTVNIAVANPPGDMTARRVGNAWLIVQGGRDVAQRLLLLQHLHIEIARLATRAA
jgi:hypothetical protein